MRKLLFLAFLLSLIGTLSLPACRTTGGGDDNSGGNTDDDNGSNDDDASGDDDNASSYTWTDSSSGLTWQVEPAGNSMSWGEAKSHCDNLNFDGHDDWHLPTISELRSLIRGCDATVPGGACDITDDCLDSSCLNGACLNGCDYLAGPGSGGAYWPLELSGEISMLGHWSSSTLADYDFVLFIDFGFGLVNYASGDVASGAGVRCVR